MDSRKSKLEKSSHRNFFLGRHNMESSNSTNHIKQTKFKWNKKVLDSIRIHRKNYQENAKRKETTTTEDEQTNKYSRVSFAIKEEL